MTAANRSSPGTQPEPDGTDVDVDVDERVDVEPPPVRLFTCRYQRFDPSMGLAVRTTVWPPRWRLRYELVGYVRELAPTAAMLRWPLEPYRTEYHAQLHRVGVPAIRRLLASIAATHGDDRVVLLCFDDLSKPGAWCHRRIFADWWTEHTGEQVPELAEQPGSGQSQPELF